MKKFLKRLIPENIAGILGVAQVAIPLVREFAILALRIVSVFKPSWGVFIPKISSVMTSVEEGFVKAKDFFLKADDSQ